MTLTLVIAIAALGLQLYNLFINRRNKKYLGYLKNINDKYQSTLIQYSDIRYAQRDLIDRFINLSGIFKKIVDLQALLYKEDYSIDKADVEIQLRTTMKTYEFNRKKCIELAMGINKKVNTLDIELEELVELIEKYEREVQ